MRTEKKARKIIRRTVAVLRRVPPPPLLPPMAPAEASAPPRVAVFTETNIGTRIALSVAPDITVSDFKRTLEREYTGCFAGSGAITVHGVMVKLRSRFYHLPDTTTIKHVFKEAAEAWFLHVDLSSDGLNGPCRKDHGSAEDGILINQSSLTSRENRAGETRVANLEPCLTHCHSEEEKKGKGNLLKSCHLNRHEKNENNALAPCDNAGKPANGGRSEPMGETSGATSSRVISVGGIIRRYFSSIEENDCVTSPVFNSRSVPRHCKERRKASAEFAVRTPPWPLSSSRDRRERNRVGNRLVTAAYVLGVSPGRKTVPSLCKSQNGKSTPIEKRLVFEMSDSSNDQCRP